MGSVDRVHGVDAGLAAGEQEVAHGLADAGPCGDSRHAVLDVVGATTRHSTESKAFSSRAVRSDRIGHDPTLVDLAMGERGSRLTGRALPAIRALLLGAGLLLIRRVVTGVCLV